MERRFDIRVDDLSGGPTRALLAFHLAGMHANSPPENVFALDLSGLQAPGITVWTAWSGDDIAAVGALKEHGEGLGEIKSMRTHPAFVGSGAGRAILRHIVGEARARSLIRLSLETGSGAAFEPAIGLYSAYGFAEGGPFAGYSESGFSRFFHLDL